MWSFTERARLGFIAVLILGTLMILGGCAPTINYTYDPRMDFSPLKSYRWAPGTTVIYPDALIEKNVCFEADQSLRQKGFTLVSDRPDLVFSMNYEYEIGTYPPSYRLKMLSLYARKAQGQELIWQGTASGTIKTNASSGDLALIVKKILENFPPKR